MVLNLPESKTDARRMVRAARRARRSAASEHDWVGVATALSDGLDRWLAGRDDVTNVAVYQSLRTEPPTCVLIERLTAAQVGLLVPVLLTDNDLSWRELGSGVDLGPAGIARADLLLVPALAIDRHRMRLGQGGGSYDRALARRRADSPVVAAVFDDEVVDHVPAQTHDLGVDLVLTPCGGVHDPTFPGTGSPARAT